VASGQNLDSSSGFHSDTVSKDKFVTFRMGGIMSNFKWSLFLSFSHVPSYHYFFVPLFSPCSFLSLLFYFLLPLSKDFDSFIPWLAAKAWNFQDFKVLIYISLSHSLVTTVAKSSRHDIFHVVPSASVAWNVKINIEYLRPSLERTKNTNCSSFFLILHCFSCNLNDFNLVKKS